MSEDQDGVVGGVADDAAAPVVEESHGGDHGGDEAGHGHGGQPPHDGDGEATV